VANAVNNRGQVAGGALNTIPDPYSGLLLRGGSKWFPPRVTSCDSKVCQNDGGRMWALPLGSLR
jgi:hypothetical protein